jgi:N-acetylglutamate synthase/N-acetylornithine aminotransferase
MALVDEIVKSGLYNVFHGTSGSTNRRHSSADCSKDAALSKQAVVVLSTVIKAVSLLTHCTETGKGP